MRVQHPGGGVSRVKKADALHSDANRIMGRYIAHKIHPTEQIGNLEYGDFTNVDDYHAMLTRVRQAQQSFDQLPARVKKLCNQDPGKFVDMVYDAEGRRALAEAGMHEFQAPADAPEPAPPVPPTPENPPPE